MVGVMNAWCKSNFQLANLYLANKLNMRNNSAVLTVLLEEPALYSIKVFVIFRRHLGNHWLEVYAHCTLTNTCHPIVSKCVCLLLLFVLSVMNLDRLENQTHVRRRFPRYHTSLFRGQALWDPNTHVILPPAALVPQRQQQLHNWKEKERTEKERKNRRTPVIKSLIV